MFHCLFFSQVGTIPKKMKKEKVKKQKILVSHFSTTRKIFSRENKYPFQEKKCKSADSTFSVSTDYFKAALPLTWSVGERGVYI